MLQSLEESWYFWKSEGQSQDNTAVFEFKSHQNLTRIFRSLLIHYSIRFILDSIMNIPKDLIAHDLNLAKSKVVRIQITL